MPNIINVVVSKQSNGSISTSEPVILKTIPVITSTNTIRSEEHTSELQSH